MKLRPIITCHKETYNYPLVTEDNMVAVNVKADLPEAREIVEKLSHPATFYAQELFEFLEDIAANDKTHYSSIELRMAVGRAQELYDRIGDGE